MILASVRLYRLMEEHSAIKYAFHEANIKAPELFNQYAKFTSKADVFAAGIIILELMSMHPPNNLHYELWPIVLELAMPHALFLSLTGTLNVDPAKRSSFSELFIMLSGDEGKKIADQDNEVDAAEFYDVSGKIQDCLDSSAIKSSSSARFSQF
jgi:serine/threonine protein kinase